MVNESLKLVRKDTTSLSEDVANVTKMHSELAVHVQLGLKAMTETFAVNYKEMKRMNEGLQEIGQAAVDSRQLLMGTHREMLETKAADQVRKLHRDRIDMMKREKSLLAAEHKAAIDTAKYEAKRLAKENSDILEARVASALLEERKTIGKPVDGEGRDVTEELSLLRNASKDNVIVKARL
jgi:alpha-galactosidase/6-phospho-beta-glucosidase family protein